MFRNFLRITEPFLKALSHRSMSPWKGNHVMYVSEASRLSEC